MGAEVEVTPERILVRARELVGGEHDLNATPDALPTMAVLGCFARGETRLVNVPQARIKETDRIAVMAQELGRMGARVEELADGLVVQESALHGAEVDGHGDHRVVMALAVAGCCVPGATVVHGAEAAAVTFPEFSECLRGLRADLTVIE
jgi:3-phosphoshikimate 1-carboxyvinyltransferase